MNPLEHSLYLVDAAISTALFVNLKGTRGWQRISDLKNRQIRSGKSVHHSTDLASEKVIRTINAIMLWRARIAKKNKANIPVISMLKTAPLPYCELGALRVVWRTRGTVIRLA
jgi:hypothetical protein